MFKVNVMFDPSRNPGAILQERPQPFLLPPHGQSQDWEFDPTVHYELEPEKKEGEEGDGDQEEDEDEEQYDD